MSLCRTVAIRDRPNNEAQTIKQKKSLLTIRQGVGAILPTWNMENTIDEVECRKARRKLSMYKIIIM